MNHDRSARYRGSERPPIESVASDDTAAMRRFVLGTGPNECSDVESPRDESGDQASSDVPGSARDEDVGA